MMRSDNMIESTGHDKCTMSEIKKKENGREIE